MHVAIDGVTLEDVLAQAKLLSPEEQQTLSRRLSDMSGEAQGRSKEDVLDQRLLEAGLLSDIPSRLTDSVSDGQRVIGKTTGKPISEVIIEERR
jgi:hypothetical protein